MNEKNLSNEIEDDINFQLSVIFNCDISEIKDAMISIRAYEFNIEPDLEKLEELFRLECIDFYNLELS